MAEHGLCAARRKGFAVVAAIGRSGIGLLADAHAIVVAVTGAGSAGAGRPALDAMDCRPCAGITRCKFAWHAGDGVFAAAGIATRFFIGALLDFVDRERVGARAVAIQCGEPHVAAAVGVFSEATSRRHRLSRRRSR